MKRLLVLLSLLGLWTSGCLPFGLGGEVGGQELGFVDVTYVELRGTDSTATPIHEIDVWLMPLEDSCERFGPMLTTLDELRADLDFGLPPEDYCDAWELIWEEHTGLESFWVGHFRLHALPRGDNESPKTSYAWFDEQGEGHPEGPSWDADLASYPAPTFDACATEFSGDALYAPTFFGASGGSVELTAYTEDESLTAKLLPAFDSAGEGEIKGQASAEHCGAALDWTMDFGQDTAGD